MSVERSERGVLITNADYVQDWEYTIYNSISVSGQWTALDNYTIYARNVGDGSYTDDKRGLQYVLFNGYSGLNYELEYSVVVKEYNSNTVLFESGWIPNNEACQCYATWNNERRRPTIIVYVRRNEFDDNGNRRYLVPSDMRPSFFRQVWKVRQTVEQTTAIPQNWLETTTQSIPTYTTQTTMLTTVDYESYLSTLTVPADVRPAIAQLDQLINDLWSLHYIPFVVCFALIMGLAMWLLH